MKWCIVTVLALSAYAFGSAQHEFDDTFSYQNGAFPQPIDISSYGKDLTGVSGETRVLERNVVADAIHNALDGLRDIVINGNGDVPPLDPLIIPHIGPFEYSATGVRVNANIRNFKMDGLRWFIVDHVTFNAIRLALGVQITVPWLTFTGSYDASARIALIGHQAGGNYRIFINRLQTSVDIRVGTNILGGGTLILRELNIRIVINDINIQLEGMVGSSVLNNLINSFVQDAAQNLIRNELEQISKMISEQLFDAVNELLGNFTLDDLLG